MSYLRGGAWRGGGGPNSIPPPGWPDDDDRNIPPVGWVILVLVFALAVFLACAGPVKMVWDGTFWGR